MPFGVNLPLLYANIDEHIKVIIEEEVKIVFTSAGNPKIYTSKLQDHGIKVVHVIANKKFAIKCVESGVDAIVAEGFEAGGHNGIEELTTMCLIPLISKEVDLPIIAAGGISSGNSMLAAFSLGAEGIQMGSRFVASKECSAHINFKSKVIDSDDNETELTLKELTAVRLMKNDFFYQIKDAYSKNASVIELKKILGKGRAKKGMFEGDLKNGELEIGQVSALLDDILPVSEIMSQIILEYEEAVLRINKFKI
tara:strand:- start:1750 stop:2508 length:759 start_codon:yes stop_codon:yes gene_type:complete